MRLCQASVLTGRLNSSRGFDRLAEGLNRYAWSWRNMRFAFGGNPHAFSDILTMLNHLPTSLILDS
jgi:hypothetical protein